MIKILRPTEEQVNTWTTSATPECKHKNGWYVRIYFWIFWKYVFVCSDCGKVMKPKDVRK